MNWFHKRFHQSSLLFMCCYAFICCTNGEDLIVHELQNIVKSVPIENFAEDVTLLQSHDIASNKTIYKQRVYAGNNSIITTDIYQRPLNDTGKIAIVLLPNKDSTTSNKFRRVYSVMRKVPESSASYFVSYLYLREINPTDPKRNQKKFGSTNYVIEFDTWDNRGNQNENYIEYGWTKCSSSIFVPCKSKKIIRQDDDALLQIMREAKKQRILVREQNFLKLPKTRHARSSVVTTNGSDPDAMIDYYEDFQHDMVEGLYSGNRRRFPANDTRDQQKLGRGLLSELTTILNLDTEQLTDSLGLNLGHKKSSPAKNVKKNKKKTTTKPPRIKENKPPVGKPKKNKNQDPEIVRNFIRAKPRKIKTGGIPAARRKPKEDSVVLLTKYRDEEKENIRAELIQEKAGGVVGLIQFVKEDYSEEMSTTTENPDDDDYEPDHASFGRSLNFDRTMGQVESGENKSYRSLMNEMTAANQSMEFLLKRNPALTSTTQPAKIHDYQGDKLHSRMRREGIFEDAGKNDEPHVYALPGWMLIKPIKSEKDLPNTSEDIFIGFGACPYSKITKSNLEDSKTQEEILTAYLTMLRTACVPEEIDFFTTIFQNGCLKTHSRKMIRITDQCSLWGKAKLKDSELKQLSRSVELAAFSGAIQNKMNAASHESVTVLDGFAISNNVDVIAKFVFEIFHIARSIPLHLHVVRIHRNTLQTLELIYEHLLTDFAMLYTCNECSKARIVDLNDRTYIKGLIMFILHEVHPSFLTPNVEKTFETFFLANIENIRHKVHIHKI